MTETEYRAAIANLYGDAAARVESSWARGRLEKRSAQPHSSQALCVSVLETLAGAQPEQRRAVLQAITAEAGLAALIGPSVKLAAEVREHRDVLGETGAGTPTSLDGLAQWTGGVLTIESKFGEAEFGTCGQTKKHSVEPPDLHAASGSLKVRVANCTGIHGVGSDTKPSTVTKNAACRLTVKDGRRDPRRYWDVAPRLFDAHVLTIPQPCPFANDNYQLMRNLAFAHEWPGRSPDDWFGTLICLVDRSPHASELRARAESFRTMLRPEVRDRIAAISYEHIADVLVAHGEFVLAEWVRRRITDVAIARSW